MDAAKFDETVAKLKADNFESPTMLQVLDLVVEQNERIKNLETASLAHNTTLQTSPAPLWVGDATVCTYGAPSG